MTDPLSLS